MAGPSSTVDQNLLPVQAYFDVYGNFQTFIGQGHPFYATINPIQSGLTITNSTIDSTTIGATTPSTGVFTNVSATTGQIANSPLNATDIANKLYVDTIAQGLNPKAACKCATLSNITLSGLQTIDTYSVQAGNRVLVKNQTNQAENGIYIASASTWTRATDMDVWAEVPGAYTVVLNGSQANTAWVSTSADTGTIGVTPITFVQFSGVSTYYAGTGLTLSSNTFSITPVGTAGTYGSASSVPVLTTNASGQVTSVTNTSIAIANTQVSGLGTMSTQNASSVAITGGSIDGTPIGATTATTVKGTTITATTQFSGSGTGLTGTATSLNIGGNAATATSAGSVTNSVTFTNTGGASPGAIYNGSSAKTIDYSTLGAPSATGTGASGTWGINITGNAATVTNGVYTTGSYSNPTWITSILGSIVSGAVASATLAASATNIAGGTTGALAYQTGSGATSFLSLGTTNYVLTAGASAPQYVAQSTLSVGSATTATTATNLAGGSSNQIPYQTSAGATSFISAPTNNTVLSYTTGGGFAWTTPVSYATVTDDTTTNATRYPLFASATSGNLTTEYTSSTKYQFNPSTGVLTATGFSGSGSSLTSLPAGQLTGTIPSGVLGNSSLYIGTTQVPLNAASGSITSLAVNISGSAASTTTATNATNIAITDNTSSSATWYPTIVATTSGNQPATTSSTKLSFVPSTGTLNATVHAGFIAPSAGTTSTAPIQFASGSLLTSANQGAQEFDGNLLYITGNTSTGNGRQIIQASQVAQLASSASVANGGQFFTATVRPYLIGSNLYKFSYLCNFSTSSAQSVTFSFSNLAAINFTNLNATVTLIQQGYGTTSVSNIYASGSATTTQQASLTLTASTSYMALIEGYVVAASATRLQLLVGSTSGITSLLGSYFVVTDLGSGNIGNIA